MIRGRMILFHLSLWLYFSLTVLCIPVNDDKPTTFKNVDDIAEDIRNCIVKTPKKGRGVADFAMEVHANWSRMAKERETKLVGNLDHVRDFASYMRCAEEVRMSIEQMEVRYMNENDKKRSKEINEDVGQMVDQRNDQIFRLVKQFASMTRDTKDESLQMDDKKRSQLEKEWKSLIGQKIDPKTADIDIKPEHLAEEILKLVEATDFEKALTIWAGQEIWRTLKAVWADKKNPDLSSAPDWCQKSVKYLARVSLAVELIEGLSFNSLMRKTDERYAELMMTKYCKQGEIPSSKYYRKIVWILIAKFEEKPIKEVFNHFKAETLVEELQPKLSKNDFLNLVDAFGEKFDRLQQISSLIDFHPARRSLHDYCPITSENFEKYVATVGKADPILKNVIRSLKNLVEVVEGNQPTK